MARVQVGSLSITGNFRDNNEDRFALDPDGRFFLVADGMGGQSAGEKASEMATELLQEHLVKQLDFDETSSEAVIETIDRVVALANTEIVAIAEYNDDRRQAVGERFGVEALYKDAESLLNDVVPDIAAIITPTKWFKEAVIACAEAGVRGVSTDKWRTYQVPATFRD